MATDLTDEIDLYISTFDNELLKKLLLQIKVDLFLKNYFYKKLMEDTKPERFFEKLESKGVFNNPPVYSEQSEETYINYPWIEGEYLYSIIKNKREEIKLILDYIQKEFIENIGQRKFNFLFIDTYFKIILKFKEYDQNYAIVNLTKLFQVANRIFLSTNQKDFLDLTKLALTTRKTDLVVPLWQALLKINWEYSEYNYIGYKTYSFKHSSLLSEYEYELLLEKGLNIFQENLFVFIKILSEVLFKYESTWSNDIQNDFRRQIIYRPTIEDHEQTEKNTNLIEKIFVLIRNISEQLPIEQIYKQFQIYQEWPIINRLMIYLVSRKGKLNLVKKFLLNEQNFKSSSLYHEYYWLLHKHFMKLSSDEQQIIYKFIDTYSDSFKEPELKNI